MDFSQYNAAEQAQMTKIIEKKQVSGCGMSWQHVRGHLRLVFVQSPNSRCKTLCACTLVSLSGVSTHVPRTLPPRP